MTPSSCAAWRRNLASLSSCARRICRSFMATPRRAGAAGRGGIRPVTRTGLVRPLIAIGRDDVEKFLMDRGIPWREDATNQDLGFARNRIRHELLPNLARN